MRDIVVLLLPLALATHYEDPREGCSSDEQAVRVQEVPGEFCSPPCHGPVCPDDPPGGSSASTAKPTCALRSPGGVYCALVCLSEDNAACPNGASCQKVDNMGIGICTYPDPERPPPSTGKAGEWTVLTGQFSAVTVGINFRNDKVGWTTQTTGSSAPSVVKTTDGGASWEPVAHSPATPMPMSVAAKKGSGDVGVVGVTGLASSAYSLDGENFNRSIAAVLASQDIKYQDDRMTLTTASGPCVSTTNGILYSCHKVPYKYGQTGRYSSSPSANVIYHTAGTWPRKSQPRDDSFEITRNLRMVRQAGAVRYEVGPRVQVDELSGDNDTYTAELWKSSDGGKTWKNLIADEGSFYFNDIHCIDETHCVAVGEGFGADGSKNPGARVYVTTDGETFTEAHRENTTGTESLMAARMLTTREHWVGGTTKSGGVTAPVLALHSTDGGETYTNEHGMVVGQMITAMDFISNQHGYATTVNAMQVSSLLQYGVAPAIEPMHLLYNESLLV